MGFGAEITSKKEKNLGEILAQAQQHDVIKYGIIPELVGRLPVITPLNSLDREALERILTEPKNAITKQYTALMALDGVKLEFDHAAIEAIADKALEMEIGARGLRSILEKIMTDIMFRVPSDKSIKRVIITADCVKDGKPPVALRNDNSDSVTKRNTWQTAGHVPARLLWRITYERKYQPNHDIADARTPRRFSISRTVLHFDVERPMSIAALNAAIGTDRVIFLVAQRDIACDTPRADDLYTVGTICRLSQILRAPGGGNVKCIVDGLYRAKLLRLTAETPALWANVRVLADKPVDADTLECTELIRSCNDLFAEYASASGTIGPETLLRVADRKEPGFVSDYIAQNVFLQPAEKQLLLEECSPLQRLTMLCDMLHRELEIMDIQQNLQSTAAERVAKNQKDYFLREQMRVIQEELGEASETDDLDEYRRKILDLGLDAEIEKKLLKELSRLAKQPFGSAEGAVLRTYLDVCLELPWNEDEGRHRYRPREKRFWMRITTVLRRSKTVYWSILPYGRLSAQVKGGVLCLVGPPGVGKTSIAMSIARATNRKCARISLGGVHDEAEIRGHRKTYVGAMPGRIIAGIQQAGSRNPVLVLDEIDKLGSDYRGDPPLLEALDGEQNGSFRDHFLEIPFDLSEVLFITTANTADTIPRALLDRMEVISLGSYTDEEKLQIAKQHLLPKQRTKHGLSGNQLRVSDDAIREIIALYTRESGVRMLERELAALCRKAARGIASGERRSLRLRAGELEPWLGPVKFKPEVNFSTDSVGLVHGLAWTSVGGEVLDVECSVVPGSGKLEPTGNLGDVMKESCQAAVTYIRSRTSGARH